MRPRIRITNIQNGEVLTFPLAIIRGTINGKLTEVFVSTSATGEPRSVRYPVVNNCFTVQYYLKTGGNKIYLSHRNCLSNSIAITLVYQPQSLVLPHVRLIYLLTSDSDGSFQAPDEQQNDLNEGIRRLRTAGLMIQSATAEMMKTHGFDRRTFRLCERVIVHRLSSLTTTEAHKKDGEDLWGITAASLGNLENRDDFIDIAVMSFTRFKNKAPRAHTALGGGFLALFGGGNLFTWPTTTTDIPSVLLDSRPFDRNRFFDDSGGHARSRGRRACTATTIGALLHELGHCLSLPHPCADADAHGGGIMSRGFDFFDHIFVQSQSNYPMPFWDRGSAVRLRFHRFLQSDVEFLAKKMALSFPLHTPDPEHTEEGQEQTEPIPSVEPEPFNTPEGMSKIDLNTTTDTTSLPILAHESQTISPTNLQHTPDGVDTPHTISDEVRPLFFEKRSDGVIHCRSVQGLGHIGFYCNGDNAAHEEFLDVHPTDFVLPHLSELRRRCKARNSDTISLSAIDVEGNIKEITYEEIV